MEEIPGGYLVQLLVKAWLTLKFSDVTSVLMSLRLENLEAWRFPNLCGIFLAFNSPGEKCVFILTVV